MKPFLDRIYEFSIDPNGKFKTYWDICINIICIIIAIDIPLRIAFNNPLEGIFLTFDILLTLLFSIDILFNFRTSIIIKGKHIDDRKLISKKYLRGWFTIDFIAAIPGELMLKGLLPFSPDALRLLRIFRLVRLLRFTKLIELIRRWHNLKMVNPSVIRLSLFLFWITLLSHWITCGWIMMTEQSQQMYNDEKYVMSLYWTVTTLTTVGYGDITPQSIPQIIYTMIVMIIGVCGYSYIIGNAASLISRLDLEKSNFLEKMENMNFFFRHRKLPTNLKKKITNYYSHLWDSKLSYDESTFLNDLPHSLRTEISMHLNKDLIQKVSLFKNAKIELIREVISELYPVIYTPGDYIIHRGDKGKEMFFINKGSVEVIPFNKDQSRTILETGSFFGEMSLLLDQPITADIRALEYTHMYKLTKGSLDKIIERHVHLKQKFNKIIQERKKMLKKNIQNKTAKLKKDISKPKQKKYTKNINQPKKRNSKKEFL